MHRLEGKIKSRIFDKQTELRSLKTAKNSAKLLSMQRQLILEIEKKQSEIDGLEEALKIIEQHD